MQFLGQMRTTDSINITWQALIGLAVSDNAAVAIR